MSCVWQIDVWINYNFCSSNVSFKETREKWSEIKQLSDVEKLEERTQLHFDFLSILLQSLLILWLNNDYHVASSSWLFSSCPSVFLLHSHQIDHHLYEVGWLTGCHIVPTWWMLLWQYCVSNQISLYHQNIAHSRINNTKDSRNNIWYHHFKEAQPSFDVHCRKFSPASAFTRKIYSTLTPH